MGKGKGDDKKSSAKDAGAKGGKGGGGKSKGKDDKDNSSDSKTKGAQSINVRHILVRPDPSSQAFVRWRASWLTDGLEKCEKHAKKEEALAKLKEGVKFDEVAREFSEDKARQGRRATLLAWGCAVN